MRNLAAFALASALVVSGCGGGGPEAGRSPTTSGATPTVSPQAPSTAPSSRPETLPAFPARRPVVLAQQLSRAHDWIRTRRPGSPEFQRAAELRQLAVRVLAVRGQGFAQAVLAGVGDPVRRTLAPDLQAARLLHGMTAARPDMPPWRVVAPPAADELLRHYRAAERATGVPWEYLAAIHLVETRFGRIRGFSTAGAEGPMQFMPGTWAMYGEGGDVNDPRDAIMAAARLLRANGAPGDLEGALWHYNQHRSYVGAVTSHAQAIERDPRAYRVYWHWRVLYRHRSGAHVLPVGYPQRPAVKVR